MPNDLKKLLLVNTKNGNMVRDYMIALDELFSLYSKYQREYEKNMRMILSRTNDELTKKIDKQTSKLDEQTAIIQNQSRKIDELLHMETW